MTKRQLIDEILSLNRTAQPGFLAQFSEIQLREYLGALRRAARREQYVYQSAAVADSRPAVTMKLHGQGQLREEPGARRVAAT
jgi:hypothetical protein